MIERLLPSNQRLRTLVIALAATAAVLLILLVLMPGRGSSGRGTPMAQVFAGVVQGAAASVTAAGIILIYRTLRIINFAQAAIGIAGTILTFEFLQVTELPFPIALLLGVALSTLIGTAIGLATLRVGWQFLEWLSRVYVLTDRRVVCRSGVLRMSVFQTQLKNIQHTSVFASLRERTTGLGTIGFATAGSDTFEAFWTMIRNPFGVHKIVVEAIERYGR